MEGSPVRGQQKISILQLNEAASIESFHAEIIRIIGSDLKHARVLFEITDAGTKSRQLPVWIRSYLERHPTLQKKLQKGEMVGIGGEETRATPRPAAAAPSSLVLIPIINENRVAATIGLISDPDQPPLSAEDIETARQLGYEAAPILTRLLEIERLRLENQALVAKVDSGAKEGEDIEALAEARSALAATLEMRSHQMVNIAHELRTPLAAIRGYSRMILDGRSGPINEKQAEYLRIVTDNTNRLIALVSWMSYISELSAHHLELTTFDFRDVWQECVHRHQKTLVEKSLRLNQQIADEPFMMIGDREQLASALNDLVVIAIKLASDGGTINAHLTHGREQDLNFKLSEKGQEIPAQLLSSIFDRPFNNAVKPMTYGGGADAMNLSSLYDVVGMHGGRVFVNSTAGQGATFLFTLPAVSAGGEENSNEQAIHSSRRRR